MAPQVKSKQRRGAHGMAAKIVAPAGGTVFDTSLRTGSKAPSELSVRPLEASIGLEVRGCASPST
jgi:hypothetical protein